MNRKMLSLGYAGVHSSVLRHAEKARAKYGGQEDMIVDVAFDIASSARNKGA